MYVICPMRYEMAPLLFDGLTNTAIVSGVKNSTTLIWGSLSSDGSFKSCCQQTEAEQEVDQEVDQEADQEADQDLYEIGAVAVWPTLVSLTVL